MAPSQSTAEALRRASKSPGIVMRIQEECSFCMAPEADRATRIPGKLCYNPLFRI